MKTQCFILFSLLIILQNPLFSQVYSVGVPVFDTLAIFNACGTTTCPTTTVYIDTSKFKNIITGCKTYYCVYNGINAGTCPLAPAIGDTVELTSPGIGVSLNCYTGNLKIAILLIGTPQMMNEQYFCNSNMNVSSSTGFGNSCLFSGTMKCLYNVLRDTLIKSCIIQANTSIPPEKLNESIKLFPNPAHDYFRIESPVDFKVEGVFDRIGINLELIEDDKISGTKTFNISNLDKGLYLIKLTIGERHLYQKLIKN